MKNKHPVAMFSIIVAVLSFVACEEEKASVSFDVPEQEVEAACGQCKLGLSGNGCDLAVRINGQAFFVDGAEIDDHGDAHAADGFCNAIRRAKVSGRVDDSRFVVKSFELLSGTK